MINVVTRQKVEFYLKNRTNVFIKKINGTFYLGIILECSDSHLVLLDKKVGEVFIYYSEIFKLEVLKEKGE